MFFKEENTKDDFLDILVNISLNCSVEGIYYSTSEVPE